MAGWFSAAKQAFQTQSAKEPERFAIRCACGASVEGVRTTEPQRVACSTCAQILFVLPQSLYSLPKPPRPKKPKPPEKAPAKPVVGRPVASTPVDAVKARTAEAAPKTAAEPSGGSAAAVSAPVIPPRPKVSIRRMFTPLRLVAIVICLAMGVTGYWMLRQREREIATQTLGDALKAGRKAMDEDDLPQADTEFQRAVKALDVLGRRDASAEATRQTARELAVMNQLVPKTLRELLAEAAEVSGGGNADAWPEIFRVGYHDRWVLLDAQVTAQLPENPQQPSEFLIDLPVTSGDNRLVLILKTRELANVPRDGAPRRMILVARLNECVKDSGQANVWRLHLDEKSPFLWTDMSLLARLGWTRDAELEKLLQQQAKLEGLGP